MFLDFRSKMAESVQVNTVRDGVPGLKCSFVSVVGLRSAQLDKTYVVEVMMNNLILFRFDSGLLKVSRRVVVVSEAALSFWHLARAVVFSEDFLMCSNI